MNDRMSVVSNLLTAEEYLELPDDGRLTELERGRVIEMPRPTPRHGEICFQTGYLIRRYLESDPRGRIVTNDAAVITERGPDTVRGPGVAYYSYLRVPLGPIPKGYLAVAPELV